jgi:hypothetical protein
MSSSLKKLELLSEKLKSEHFKNSNIFDFVVNTHETLRKNIEYVLFVIIYDMCLIEQ